MKVLITGSTGRVGRAIYVELMKKHEVIGVDALPSSTADVVADIRDTQALSKSLQGVDAVIHTAALHAPHVGIRSDSDFESINVSATENLMKLGIEHHIKHFVFTSSTAVFGHASHAENTTAWVTEDTTPQPKTIYHRSKLAAEEKLKQLSQLSQIPVTVLRMSRCFPESADLMSVYRLNRGVDARDVALAHLKAIEKRPTGFHTLIISGHTLFEPSDCNDLYHNCEYVIERKAPELAQAFRQRSWQLPHSLDRVYDSSAAMKLLNWRSQYGYESVLEMYDLGLSEVLPVISVN